MQERYRIPLNGVKVVRKKDGQSFTKDMKEYFNLDIDDEQILFRRDVIKEHKKLAPVYFAENDDDCFLRAGQNFFDLKKAHILLKEAKVAVKEEEPWEETEEYIAWEKPCKGDIYAAGADPAESEQPNLAGRYEVSQWVDHQRRARLHRLVFCSRCGQDRH